jgi:hypothetical protein
VTRALGAVSVGGSLPTVMVTKVSMTLDVYMTRGKVHAQVADLLDDAMSGG